MTDRCIICLEELTSDIGAISPCGHCFHRSCFEALKKNNKENDPSCGNKLPRCPMCKHKSKKFIDIYLTFEERPPGDFISSSNTNGCSNNNGNGNSNTNGNRCSSSSCDADTTQALASLTGENMRLQRSLREMKNLSKDQSELLFEVLPRLNETESNLKQMLLDKERLEEEHSELLSEWNETDMKMQLLKMEKQELKSKLRETKVKNGALVMEFDHKLQRAKKKRKIHVEALKTALLHSQSEEQELAAMLKHSQTETIKMKRIIKKFKRDQKKTQKQEQQQQQQQQKHQQQQHEHQQKPKRAKTTRTKIGRVSPYHHV